MTFVAYYVLWCSMAAAILYALERQWGDALVCLVAAGLCLGAIAR